MIARRAVTVLTVALLAMTRASGAADPVTATLRLDGGRAVVDVAIAAGYHINGHAPRDEFLIPTSLEVSPPAGMTAGAVEYPPPIERTLAFSPKPLLLYEGKITLAATLSGSGSGAVRAKLRFQACNDTTCLPPKTIELSAERTAAATPSDGGAPDANQITSLVARWGLPLTLVWIFFGGVALNLTPCVYPLISVTVSFFGGRTGRKGGGRLLHAIAYALGICITFSLLGVIAALTGSLFGAALQQPAVLGGIALLLVALALSNFGLWSLQPPAGVMQAVGRSSEGVLGSVFMGLTMGIVAAPCIGPFALGLLLYVGAQQDVGLGFAMFFALGLGLGAPYVALALAAGQLRRLPRGGAWLGWMETFFGFLLLAIALHFATPILPPIAVRIGWALLLAGGGVVLGFLGDIGGAGARALRGALGLVAIGAGVLGVVRGDAGSLVQWVPFSDAALAGATAAGQPAFIDFQADWCIPCREMEHTTFRDPAVVDVSRQMSMLRADVTAQDDQATQLMERFKVVGVPTYVLLDRTGAERRRFVGFVPAEEMRAAMEDVSRG